ncbi:MAG TPA: alpha/beta hydrolase, partial [Acidimicrobiales bacterium]|nr:alpha/beta hydrolase [Acidimicrobiales bacterium]
HATGFHSQMWRPMAEDLVTDFHVVAMDTRGHGESGRPNDGSFAWSGLAADILAVIDALGLASVRAVGHSSGGAALLLAEQARPGTFERLWLYEPILFPPASSDGPPPPNVMAEAALRRRGWFPNLHQALANYQSKPPLRDVDPAILRAYVEHGFRAADDGVALKCTPEDEAAVFAEARSHDGYQRLIEVRCPVTITGGEDSDISPSLMRRIADQLPDGQAQILPGKGHLLPFEEPLLVASLIRAAMQPAAT